jgi:hypothetical protein
MTSESTDNIPVDPKTFDAIDAAAFTLGAPALGVYLWLEMRRGVHTRAFFVSKTVREILRVKDHATLRKYLNQINEGHLARVIFTPRGDSFAYERVFSPVSVPTSTEWTGPEKSPEDRFKPDSGEKSPPSAEKIPSENAKGFVGVDLLKTTTTTSLEGLEGLASIASVNPSNPNTVKLFLGKSLMEVAIKYDVTLTVPGHLYHAWQDAVKIDGRNFSKAVDRVKNGVLYCIQQMELGIKIQNRVGYFFDSIRRGRTPSTRPEKQKVLEKIKPKERTPQEIENESQVYWESLTLDQVKEQFRGLVRMGMAQEGRPGFTWLMEGVRRSPFAADFETWRAAGCLDQDSKGGA